MPRDGSHMRDLPANLEGVCATCGKTFTSTPKRRLVKHCSGACRKAHPLAERFWSKVDRRAPDECWPWTAHRNEEGYGKITVANRSVHANRVAYELTYGPIPHKHEACHSCDNPPCCNPAHLFAGTSLDNMRDRDRKGRHKPLKGSLNGQAKLTEDQVREIIAAPHVYGSCTTLARRYGVSLGLISKIQCGDGWQHVRGSDAA